MSFPEAYTIGSNFKLNRLKEFEIDYEYPLENAVIIWEPPQLGTDYTIGTDPSWGVQQDRAAIHVLKNGTVKTKDMQVAEFCSSDMNMHDLVPVCYMLGNLYKNTVEDIEALMSVECNLSDDIVYQLRNNYQYSNLFIWKFYDSIKKQFSNKLGWWTTQRTRPKIIIKAVHYIKQGWWDIASPWLINEMQTIEKLEDKQRVEAAQGSHDDLFMAAVIALWSAHDMEFSDGSALEETAKQRDRRSTEIVNAYGKIELPPMSQRKDFQNTACFAHEVSDMEIGSNLNEQVMERYKYHND